MGYSLIVGLGLYAFACKISILHAAPAADETLLDLSGLSSSKPLPVYYAVDGKIKDPRIVIIDKSKNRMLVFRYKGQMDLEYEFHIATGAKPGRKEIEGDEKTPEGIYFTTHRYLDKKITIFGDRAVGMNYPNPIDILEKRTGSGIYIHGTNQIQPRSSNGCISLKNNDMAIIEPIIMEQSTPIIVVNNFLLPSENNENKAIDSIVTIEVPNIIKHPNALDPVLSLKTMANGDISKNYQKFRDVLETIDADVNTKEEGRVLIGLEKQWVMIVFYKVQYDNPFLSYNYTKRFYLTAQPDKKLSLIQYQWIVSDSQEFNGLSALSEVLSAIHKKTKAQIDTEKAEQLKKEAEAEAKKLAETKLKTEKEAETTAILRRKAEAEQQNINELLEQTGNIVKDTEELKAKSAKFSQEIKDHKDEIFINSNITNELNIKTKQETAKLAELNKSIKQENKNAETENKKLEELNLITLKELENAILNKEKTEAALSDIQNQLEKASGEYSKKLAEFKAEITEKSQKIAILKEKTNKTSEITNELNTKLQDETIKLNETKELIKQEEKNAKAENERLEGLYAEADKNVKNSLFLKEKIETDLINTKTQVEKLSEEHKQLAHVSQAELTEKLQKILLLQNEFQNTSALVNNLKDKVNLETEKLNELIQLKEREEKEAETEKNRLIVLYTEAEKDVKEAISLKENAETELGKYKIVKEQAEKAMEKIAEIKAESAKRTEKIALLKEEAIMNSKAADDLIKKAKEDSEILSNFIAEIKQEEKKIAELAMQINNDSEYAKKLKADATRLATVVDIPDSSIATNAESSDKKSEEQKLSAERDKKEEKLIRSMLDNWLTAWQEKKIDSYIAQYSEDFTFDGKNLMEWRNSKEKLFESYQVIRVKARNIEIKITENSAIVTFLQHYMSDMYRDTGYKTLHLIKTGDKWQISKELWEAIKQ